MFPATVGISYHLVLPARITDRYSGFKVVRRTLDLNWRIVIGFHHENDSTATRLTSALRQSPYAFTHQYVLRRQHSTVGEISRSRSVYMKPKGPTCNQSNKIRFMNDILVFTARLDFSDYQLPIVA